MGAPWGLISRCGRAQPASSLGLLIRAHFTDTETEAQGGGSALGVYPASSEPTQLHSAPCLPQPGPSPDPESLSHPQGNGVTDCTGGAGAGAEAKAALPGHFPGPPAPLPPRLPGLGQTHAYTCKHTPGLMVQRANPQGPAQSAPSAPLTPALQPRQPPHRASWGPHFSSPWALVHAAPCLNPCPPLPSSVPAD